MENKKSTLTKKEKIFCICIAVIALVVTAFAVVRWTDFAKDDVTAVTVNETVVTTDATVATVNETLATTDATVDATEETETDAIEEAPTIKDEIFHDVVVSYLEGKWDGSEMTYKGHKVQRKENSGKILIDNYEYFIPNEKYDIGEYKGVCIDDLDIPSVYIDSCSLYPGFAYVPGEGTYAIIDNKLVKFLRGEMIPITDYELSWEGFSNSEQISEEYGSGAILISSPTLHYKDGKLYLFASDETCTIDVPDRYVYVFDKEYYMSYLGKLNIDDYL